MSLNSHDVEEFKKLFSGSKNNYLKLVYGKDEVNGKLQGEYRTVKDKLITITDYKKHLEGKEGLGIIPISEDSKCFFSAIDIDIYNEDMITFIEAIDKHKFPLVPFKSKSGGLHLYSFFKQAQSPKEAVKIMKSMASILAIDTYVKNKTNRTVEIFPKQTKLRDGEIGNAINLPYYNHKETKQVAIKEGQELSLPEALSYIKGKMTTVKDMREFLHDLDYNDAPPCLQSITILDPLDFNSGRNIFLFSLGVYLKKKDEDFFEQQLLEANGNLKYPLSEKEVEKTIVSSLRKRDYEYKCNDFPCSDYCNKNECRKREFGVGKDDGYFSTIECGVLTQYKSKQPYYEWEVRRQDQEKYTRLVFKSEDELLKQDTFIKLCMRELYEIPTKLKQHEWFKKVNQALKEVDVKTIDEADDTSPIILLKLSVFEFITGRVPAENRRQIEDGRVFFDSSSGEYWFRMRDLVVYVNDKKRGLNFDKQEVYRLLKDDFKAEMNKDVNTESNGKDKRKKLRVVTVKKELLNYFEPVEKSFEPDFSDFIEDF